MAKPRRWKPGRRRPSPNRYADTLCPQCGGPAETHAPKNKLKQGQTYYYRAYIKCTVCHRQTNVESSKRLVLEGRNATNCDDPDDPRCSCLLCESRNKIE